VSIFFSPSVPTMDYVVLRQQFDEMDRDHDGRISAKEMATGLRIPDHEANDRLKGAGYAPGSSIDVNTFMRVAALTDARASTVPIRGAHANAPHGPTAIPQMHSATPSLTPSVEKANGTTKAHGTHGRRASIPVDVQAKFDLLDKDRDGFLNTMEYADLLVARGYDMPITELLTLFKEAGCQSPGRMDVHSFLELRSLLKERFPDGPPKSPASRTLPQQQTPAPQRMNSGAASVDKAIALAPAPGHHTTTVTTSSRQQGSVITSTGATKVETGSRIGSGTHLHPQASQLPEAISHIGSGSHTQPQPSPLPEGTHQKGPTASGTIQQAAPVVGFGAPHATTPSEGTGQPRRSSVTESISKPAHASIPQPNPAEKSATPSAAGQQPRKMSSSEVPGEASKQPRKMSSSEVPGESEWKTAGNGFVYKNVPSNPVGVVFIDGGVREAVKNFPPDQVVVCTYSVTQKCHSLVQRK